MNCFIIGNGGWGTALGTVLAANGHSVAVWGPFEEEIRAVREEGENRPYLPGVSLPKEIEWTSDPAGLRSADLAVLVTPSRFFRSTVGQLSSYLNRNTTVVSATKGFDEKTRRRMSETAEEILGVPVCALSGPSHAEEVARGVPTAVTVAGGQAERIQTAFTGKTFRVYTSDDMIGVETGGALKNIIAVAVGILDGIGLGDNSKAALMTRGLAEITRLGVALGAKPETFSGLSGMGDLIVTCSSRHSRNRSIGERLGRGDSLDEILKGMKQAAEGIWNAKVAGDLSREYGVDMPITKEVRAIVEKRKDPRQALTDLMSRDPKPELPPAHPASSEG